MKTLQEEILIKSMAPNYVGSGLFINPNKNGVVSTEMLNKAAEYARTTDFFKRFVSREGFDINPADFKWEWTINFNNKSGFVVLREHGEHLRLFVYKTANDLIWEEILIKNFKNNETSMSKLVNLIKKYRNSNIR